VVTVYLIARVLPRATLQISSMYDSFEGKVVVDLGTGTVRGGCARAPRLAVKQGWRLLVACAGGV
jgi:predicted RNA methylase